MTGKYCGSVGDGCGRAMDCGGCAAGQTCSASGLCVVSNCVPLTCNVGTSRFCGTIGDGCGGMLDCGGCQAPATCAGRGTPGVCGDPNCKPITCMPAGGGQYCGVVGDGCGGTLSCSAPCPNGMTCGARPQRRRHGDPERLPWHRQRGPVQRHRLHGAHLHGQRDDDRERHDPRSRRQGAALQRERLRPECAARSDPGGASCDRCSAQLSGKPIATALTDANGRFVLQNVPVVANLPIVIQVGKWRREITLATVNPCVDNPITNADLTRLPRTKREGHIPQMALTTGGSDALECLLRKIGIADSEFTTDTGIGRVHLYIGGRRTHRAASARPFTTTLNAGAVFPNATTLWGTRSKMRGYDIMMLSCEGSQYAGAKLPFLRQHEALRRPGGRVFVEPPAFLLAVARARRPSDDGQSTSAVEGGNLSADPPTAIIDTTFPKGNALADWLVSGRRSTRCVASSPSTSGSTPCAVDAADAALDLRAHEPERQVRPSGPRRNT